MVGRRPWAYYKSEGIMSGFKEGDTVFYYNCPGQIIETLIKGFSGDGIFASLVGNYDRVIPVNGLFHTQEEAEAALSPTGKRMRGCIQEAEMIYHNTLYTIEFPHHKRMILEIAFKLFDSEGE